MGVALHIPPKYQLDASFWRDRDLKQTFLTGLGVRPNLKEQRTPTSSHSPQLSRIQSPQACLPPGSSEEAVKWPAWPQGPSQIHSRGRRKGEGNPQG